MDIPSFWATLGTTIWWFLALYLFVAYLMVLFAVVGDVFRDRSLGGVAKAVWVFFLVATPMITALVYLIARGRGMNERAAARSAEAEAAAAHYIRSVSGGGGAVGDIARAKELLAEGAITEDEYLALKAAALKTVV